MHETNITLDLFMKLHEFFLNQSKTIGQETITIYRYRKLCYECQ